jgi:hypothetical protein
MESMTPCGNFKADMKYVGRASSTAFPRIAWPMWLRRDACQLARYRLALLIIGEKADWLSFTFEKGRPKYVYGNPSCWQPRQRSIGGSRASSTCMGTTVLWVKLMCRPVASGKSSKSALKR